MSTTTKTVSTGKSKSGEHTGPARKVLSFGLGKEEYGLDILAVREIIGVIDITPLPRTPDYVKGVINLRGKIIPVIELRARFALPSVAYTEETCVIVVDVPADGNGEGGLIALVLAVVARMQIEIEEVDRVLLRPRPHRLARDVSADRRHHFQAESGDGRLQHHDHDERRNELDDVREATSLRRRCGSAKHCVPQISTTPAERFADNAD